LEGPRRMTGARVGLLDRLLCLGCQALLERTEGRDSLPVWFWVQDRYRYALGLADQATDRARGCLGRAS
jgi:hypothetical protein